MIDPEASQLAAALKSADSVVADANEELLAGNGDIILGNGRLPEASNDQKDPQTREGVIEGSDNMERRPDILPMLIERIEADISGYERSYICPESINTIVGTLIYLLKIRPNKDSPALWIEMCDDVISALEKNVVNIGKAKYPKIRDCAANLLFLDDEQCATLQKYLESKKVKAPEYEPARGLREFLITQLGSDIVIREDLVGIDEGNHWGLYTELSEAGDLPGSIEDFTIATSEKVDIKLISQVLADFYTKQGFVIKDHGNYLLLYNGKKNYVASFTNEEKRIQVTVFSPGRDTKRRMSEGY